MADVELVIKIPEKVYNALIHIEFDANLVTDEMRKSIANGTPLPVTNAGDLISRQAVIEWLKDKDIIKTKNQEENARRELAELPSVEPERKKGKWEYIQYDGNPKIGNWHCSNCRLIVNLGFEGKPYYDYCPGCGAKMEVDNG